MTKLFTRVFASLPDDVKLDNILHEKMALVQQFIRPENLDINPPFQNETSWLVSKNKHLSICVCMCLSVHKNMCVCVSLCIRFPNKILKYGYFYN